MAEFFKEYYSSPIGVIEILSDTDAIISILFVERAGATTENSPVVMRKCLTQLDEYFKGTRKEFTLSLNQHGTVFQEKVWSELHKIPFGKTSTYLNIAKKVGDKNSIRAVGGANGKNKISIIVPCHRVIGHNHELVGYAGGKWRKQWLLEHEASFTSGQQKLF